MKKSIYCKSALISNQLSHRKELDCDGIEIQLLKDFVYNPLSSKQYMDILKSHEKDIKALHVPLDGDEDLVELQMLYDENIQTRFERICELAKHITEYSHESVLIVIHNRWSANDFSIRPDIYEKVVGFLKLMIDTYPDIKIGIENVIPFEAGAAGFSNGCLPSYANVVKDLRESTGSDRIGAVLDTCHMMVTQKFLTVIDVCDDIDVSKTAEDYFKEVKDICFLIHLCNVSGFGYRKGTHGIPFTNESKDVLDHMLKLHAAYTPDAPITLEIAEDDYLNCVNYSITRELIG